MLRPYPAWETGIAYANTRQTLPIAIMVTIDPAMIVVVVMVVITVIVAVVTIRVVVVAVIICRSGRRGDRAEQQA
jgi:hypothetical protein